MSTPMLKISGVHTFYGSIEALKGVDMEVSAGEIVTLIGANGAGKSTLLMTICGNPRAKSGSVHFEGEDITRVPTFEIVRRGIAQSPEGRRIFGRMTVLENLQMGSITAQPGSFSKELERVYTLFPRLKERQAQRGGTLSGGEQQMLAIGRALMSRPRLLLLDEPSLGLAPLMVERIFETIASLKASGRTILLVEQNVHHALDVADRAYVLETGRVTLDGPVDVLRRNPKVEQSYLGVGGVSA